ncbi:starch synthase [Natranaerovirga pectinivora]|uniref:Glycogen synthase n=1 Tax=Natranaerovirga pectinivora TaxID=682400 RepID=A0A4R3MM44_9FIRM|nr:glycogen synthase GlgA [Natranaerovirga pectinivora]TCT15363.1 starch synthase [Natranaerovirga pectinivora]
MNVLFVASEGVPFSKSGGLGDVIGSLPIELLKNGTDVRVILPKYDSIPIHLKEKMHKKAEFYVQLGWRNQYCGIEELEYRGVKFYFIDNEYYFKRDVLYGYYDEAERYAFFSKAVLEGLLYLEFDIDIIHCHDWHSGMIGFLLKTKYKDNPLYNKIKTVYTIHNLKFQGIYSKEIYEDFFEMEDKYYNSEELEFNGCVNSMKGGLVFSDAITTVSESYALEIQYPFFGEGLDGVLRKRERDVFGIINGIDYEEFNPSIDDRIYKTYDSENIYFKKDNKEKLQKELGLEVNNNIPIIGIVSRLTDQKGMNLIECVLEELLNKEVQMIVLGTGDYKYESLFHYMSGKYPGKISANIMFNEDLAHKIYAGADFLLMPSLFEPCGLSQLIALKYGTIPIVRETGGLRDTITPYNEFTGEGNGFSFANYNAHEMLYTINRAIMFYNDKNILSTIRRAGMEKDFSWSSSAKKYIELYNKL